MAIENIKLLGQDLKKLHNDLNIVSEQLLSNFSNDDLQPVKDYGWDHRIWSNEKFRWAHYEHYTTDKVDIVHLVVMPWQNSRAPIFGFDIINISGNLTGMFLDLTPVDDRTFDLPQLGTPRPRPDWGDFFSDSFVCTKPNHIDEVIIATRILVGYLKWLPDTTNQDYTDQQQRYIDGQRQNPQTRKMLSAHVGEDKANEYFYTYLFPDVK